MSLLSFALSRSNYKEKLKLLLDLEQLAHEDELKSRYVTIYNYYLVQLLMPDITTCPEGSL